MDGTWLLLVSVKTAVDIQLLPTRCAMIQVAINKCLSYQLGISSNVTLFSYRKIILFWKVLVLLMVICILTKACSFAPWNILT